MQASKSDSAGKPWKSAIDVHHHVVPDFYLREMQDIGFGATLPGIDKPSWNVDCSIAMMDRQGIRAAVVNVWPGIPAMEREPAARLARRVNEYLADLVSNNNNRFGAFAVLPLPHVDTAVSEFEYAIDELGLDGVGLVTNYGGIYIGDRKLDPFLAEAARRRTPLFVHPTVSPATRQPTFGLPASLCEFPFETVRLTAQLLYNNTLARHPDLRLILSHGGGGVAYFAKRLTYGPLISAELAERLPADPISSLQRLYYDVAMIGDQYALASLHSFVPATQILAGSDFPFMSDSFSADNGQYVVEFDGFNADDIAQIDHLNAVNLFPRFEPARKEK